MAGRHGIQMFLRHVRSFVRGRIPSQLVIQLTDSCNAACPQCGMRRDTPFRRTRLPMHEAKRIIDHAANSGIAALSFTGGEPFLFADELLTLLRYAGNAGIPFTRTGTNGFLFQNPDRPDFDSRVSRLAESLAATKLYTFWISVDSPVPEIHEKMRGLPGVIKGIERALPIFHEHGLFPSANLGITKAILPKRPDAGDGEHAAIEAYRAGFRAFFNRISEMGFTIVNTCYPMSVEMEDPNFLSAVYGATSAHDCVRFTRQEKVLMFRALRETIPEFRSRIRIFSPLSSLHALEKQYSGGGYSRPCRGGTDFFFVGVKGGDTYPCGYRGRDNLGKFWDIDLKKQPLNTSCRECDWECFRDPSELLGPFREIFTAPVSLARRLLQDTAHTDLWLNDLCYFRAAGFFNGRQTPDYEKLARFAEFRNGAPTEGSR